MTREIETTSNEEREAIHKVCVEHVETMLNRALEIHPYGASKLAEAIAFAIESSVRAYMENHERRNHPWKE